MRTLVCFLICTVGCRAQRPEDQVLTIYKQLEKAVQSGDANTRIGLWSRESAANAEKMRPYLRPRPEAHYTSSKAFVQGDEAALLRQIDKNQFVSMRFVKQDGRWKIKDFASSDKAYSAESVYAMIPPGGMECLYVCEVRGGRAGGGDRWLVAGGWWLVAGGHGASPVRV